MLNVLLFNIPLHYCLSVLHALKCQRVSLTWSFLWEEGWPRNRRWVFAFCPDSGLIQLYCINPLSPSCSLSGSLWELEWGNMWERLGKLYWDIQLQPPRDSLVLSSVFGFCLFVVLGIKHKALRAVKHARQVLYHWTTSLTLVLVFSRFDSFCLPAITFPRLSLLSVGLFPVFFPCACVLHSSSAPVFPWQRSCACSHLLPSLLWTPVVSTANVILLCLVLPVRFLFSNICYKKCVGFKRSPLP